ncbi:MAG: DinB family protein [Dehalococcoidia bacterium]|nr:DinB family protein [Dehalococcoidia bacterium]
MPDDSAVQQSLAQLAATPSKLAHLTVEAADQALDAAPDGEWSTRTVLAHLRDAEMLEFRVGLERLLAEPDPALYFLPPDEWERDRNRERDEKSVLLSDFALQRQASLNLIATMRDTDWEGTAPGPRDEPITVAQFVQIWAGHDAAHLGQIEELLGDTVAGAQERRSRPPE